MNKQLKRAAEFHALTVDEIAEQIRQFLQGTISQDTLEMFTEQLSEYDHAQLLLDHATDNPDRDTI